MIRVLLAEDQALVRGALTALLNLEYDIEVVAQAENGKQALSLLKEHKVDMLLTDIEMPEMTGLDLIDCVRSQYPEVKCIVITTFARAGYIKRALVKGVKGFLL